MSRGHRCWAWSVNRNHRDVLLLRAPPFTFSSLLLPSCSSQACCIRLSASVSACTACCSASLVALQRTTATELVHYADLAHLSQWLERCKISGRVHSHVVSCCYISADALQLSVRKSAVLRSFLAILCSFPVRPTHSQILPDGSRSALWALPDPGSVPSASRSICHARRTLSQPDGELN